MLTLEKKSLKAGQIVETEHVNAIIRSYKQERWASNSERIGKEDSLSVWYSLEELEGFLSHARQHGADGIRVYFGVYDKEHAPLPICEGRQTVVFVATKQRSNDDGIANKDLYVANENGSTIVAFNIGTICPPICNSNEGIGITIVEVNDGIVIA
jgi:hypothetical protein